MLPSVMPGPARFLQHEAHRLCLPLPMATTFDLYRSQLEPMLADPALTLLGLAAGAAESDAVPDPDTLSAMRRQVAKGVLSGVAPAKAWPFLAKGLMARRPSGMLDVLHDCGALARLLPELDALFGHAQSAGEADLVDIGEHQWRVVDETARRRAPLAVRFAALLYNLGKSDSPPQHLPAHYLHVERCLPRIEAICLRCGVAAELRDLALLTAAELERVHRAAPMRAASITALLERVDAFARPERFMDLMTVCACDYGAYRGNEARVYPKAILLDCAYQACLTVDERDVADGEPALHAQRLHEARAMAVARALRSERWAEEGSL
jgi:tRNA nucleotidyltransferase (CCA-adding enzyme)